MARKFEPIRRESRDVTATTARDIAYELFKRPEQQRFRLSRTRLCFDFARRRDISLALTRDNPVLLDRRVRICVNEAHFSLLRLRDLSVMAAFTATAFSRDRSCASLAT